VILQIAFNYVRDALNFATA